MPGNEHEQAMQDKSKPSFSSRRIWLDQDYLSLSTRSDLVFYFFNYFCCLVELPTEVRRLRTTCAGIGICIHMHATQNLPPNHRNVDLAPAVARLTWTQQMSNADEDADADEANGGVYSSA